MYVVSYIAREVKFRVGTWDESEALLAQCETDWNEGPHDFDGYRPVRFTWREFIEMEPSFDPREWQFDNPADCDWLPEAVASG